MKNKYKKYLYLQMLFILLRKSIFCMHVDNLSVYSDHSSTQSTDISDDELFDAIEKNAKNASKINIHFIDPRWSAKMNRLYLIEEKGREDADFDLYLTPKEMMAKNESELDNYCCFRENKQKFGTEAARHMQAIQKIALTKSKENESIKQTKLINNEKQVITPEYLENFAQILDLIIKNYNDGNEKLLHSKILMYLIYNEQALKIYLNYDATTHKFSVKNNKSLLEKFKYQNVAEDSSDEESLNGSNPLDVKNHKFSNAILLSVINMCREAEVMLLKSFNEQLVRGKLSKEEIESINFFVTGNKENMNAQTIINDYLEKGKILKNTMNNNIKQCLNSLLKTQISLGEIKKPWINDKNINVINNDFRRKCLHLSIEKKKSSSAFFFIDGYNGGIYKIEGILFIFNFQYDQTLNTFIMQKEILRDNLTCPNLYALTDIYCQLHTNNIIKPKQILRRMNYNQMMRFVQQLIDSFKDNNYNFEKGNKETTVQNLKKFSIDIKNAMDIKDETIQKKTIKQIKRNMIAYLDSLVYVNKTTTDNYTYNGVNTCWYSENLLPILGETFLSVNKISSIYYDKQTTESGESNLRIQNGIPGHIFASLRLEDDNCENPIIDNYIGMYKYKSQFLGFNILQSLKSLSNIKYVINIAFSEEYQKYENEKKILFQGIDQAKENKEDKEKIINKIFIGNQKLRISLNFNNEFFKIFQQINENLNNIINCKIGSQRQLNNLYGKYLSVFGMLKMLEQYLKTDINQSEWDLFDKYENIASLDDEYSFSDDFYKNKEEIQQEIIKLKIQKNKYISQMNKINQLLNIIRLSTENEEKKIADMETMFSFENINIETIDKQLQEMEKIINENPKYQAIKDEKKHEVCTFVIPSISLE